jgi:succinoglycan biosynthesis protein ExoM
VRGRAPPDIRVHRAYLERFFSRPGPGLSAPDEPALIDGYWGCGNSLVRRAAMTDPLRPFNAARNHIGGEDDLLFGTMHRAGARFAWAPDAWVWEDPAPERLTLGYTLRRAFAYGQGPTVAALSCQPPQRLSAMRWMAMGAVQAAVFGMAAAAQWALGSADRAFTLDRAARGLGKLLYGEPFKLTFYGQPAPGSSVGAAPAARA